MMETVVSTAAASKHHPQPYSPHLKKVLKTYQLSALKSLSGPSTVLASEEASAKIDGGKAVLLSSPSPPTPVKKEVVSTATTESERSDTKNVDNDTFLTPAPFPIQQQPILLTQDQSKSEHTETVLEGETISCFVVGGERRLCLPQILNTALSKFSLQEIHKQCDRLLIYCSRCNPKQLEILKVSGVLPLSAPSCGLITQTDAERLCSALLHCDAPRAPPHSKTNSGFLSFRVYHECFGECQGIITPALYTDRHSRCIECTECRCLFSPQHFVTHAHKKLENQTCHWGFDSTNWRSYLLLVEGQSNQDLLTTALRDFKERHVKNSLTASAKRKQVEVLLTEVKEEPTTTSSSSTTAAGKRPRLHDQQEAAVAAYAAAAYHIYEPYLYAAAASGSWYNHDPWSRLPPSAAAAAAAFRPWHSPVFAKDAAVLKALHQPSTAAALRDSIPTSVPSFLSQGPPVLLHPERVVPLSESERFERQPNVALAPAPQQLLLQRPPTHPEVKKEVVDEEDVEEGSGTAVAAEQEERKPVVVQPPSPSSRVVRPSSPPRPAYNPEIELSSDTEEDSSSERDGGHVGTTELLDRLARCVASCSEQARLQGEEALRTLGLDLLSSREDRNALAAENQLLREKVVQLEERLKSTASLHSKELEELEQRLLVSAELERQASSRRQSCERSRGSSPATSVITSAPAAAAAAAASPPLTNIKAEPAEDPPEPAE